jgi:hypothetical protein
LGVEIVIDGEKIELVNYGRSQDGKYVKYQLPDKFAGQIPGEAPLIVSVYRKPGWKPSKGSPQKQT